MTGGLAAALLPVVEHSGAIWVGSSGRVRDGHQKEPFAEIEALGTGALATLDLPAAHYGGYYEGFANRRCGRRCIRAAISFASRKATISAIARSTPSWRGRCCVSARSAPPSGCRII